jgi:hypothetical protein
VDVEVLQGVGFLTLGQDTDPVTEVLLLEELLGEVLEVLLAVGHGGGDGQHVVAHGNLHLVGELALAAVELGVLLDVLLEPSEDISAEDAVSSRDGAVNLEVLLTLGKGLSADVTASTNLSANSDHDCLKTEPRLFVGRGRNDSEKASNEHHNGMQSTHNTHKSRKLCCLVVKHHTDDLSDSFRRFFVF